MTNVNKIYTKPYLHKSLYQEREPKTPCLVQPPKMHPTWSACLGSTSGAQFDVQGTNAQLLQCTNRQQTGKRKLFFLWRCFGDGEDGFPTWHLFTAESNLQWLPLVFTPPCIVLPHPVLPTWPHMEMTLESLEICEANITFPTTWSVFPSILSWVQSCGEGHSSNVSNVKV